MLAARPEPRERMIIHLGDTPVPASGVRAPWLLGLRRGASGRCPACGEGSIFRGYLKPQPQCPKCGEDLLQYRADDAPAYFTILIVGHILVPAILMVEMTYHPAASLHLILWIPATLSLTFLLLPRIKGALIGLQWALKIKS
jgi:uncharacterized protein (DUF983 family)